MKADVLVDTSAWIEFFNKPDSETGRIVEELIIEERIALAGIVLTELLQGAKTTKEFDALLESMTALPILETSLKTYVEAGKSSFSLRRKGLTIPVTDLIIAGLARENDCSILTLDSHFSNIPGVTLFS